MSLIAAIAVLIVWIGKRKRAFWKKDWLPKPIAPSKSIVSQRSPVRPMPPADPSFIEKRVTQMFAARQITRADQDFLMSVFAKSKIDASSEALINKIYEAIAAGKIRVVE